MSGIAVKKTNFEPEEEQQRGSALEHDFPISEISQIAQHESWRKEVNRPIYHIHKWWATRLGSVFRAITLAALSPSHYPVWQRFYECHNLAGKIVLDPFMGSGTTLGEAIKLGAKAIGCDINPVSTFLVRQALTRVSEGELRQAFNYLKQGVASEIQQYYQTYDLLTGQAIPVLYFFWVKIVHTPDGEDVPLFDNYIFSKDAYPKKKPKAQIICPNCWAVIEDRYDAVNLDCVTCGYNFNPQNGPAKGQYVVTKQGNRYRIKDLIITNSNPPTHRLYALLALRPNGDKVYLSIKPEDLELYKKAERRFETEDLPLPTLAVRPGYNTNQARGYNYFYWRDFFNARQLLCLGLLLRAILKIENQTIQEQMLCLFSSTLEFNNLFCSFKGEGTGAVRHMFSNHILKPERTPLENSVWGITKSSGTFSTLFESRLIRAKRYLDQPFEISLQKSFFNNCNNAQKIIASDPVNTDIVSTWSGFIEGDKKTLILNGDSSHLSIPDKSIDAIITDPPYFDFVHYSELSDFFFAWLSPVIKNRYSWFGQEDSSNKGEVQHKDPRIFANQISCVFIESNRVLKDDGILVFSFHHSRSEGWAAIYEALINAGFSVVAAYPVHAELRTARPKSATKNPITLDAVLVCRKLNLQSSSIIDMQAVIRRTLKLTEKLKTENSDISIADMFVIAASQLLVEFSGKKMTFDEIEVQLKYLREKFFSDERGSVRLGLL